MATPVTVGGSCEKISTASVAASELALYDSGALARMRQFTDGKLPPDVPIDYFVGGNSSWTAKYKGEPVVTVMGNGRWMPENHAQAFANAMAILHSRAAMAREWRGYVGEKVADMQVQRAEARTADEAARAVAIRKIVATKRMRTPVLVKTLRGLVKTAKAKAPVPATRVVKAPKAPKAKSSRGVWIAVGVATGVAIGGYAIVKARAGR